MWKRIQHGIWVALIAIWPLTSLANTSIDFQFNTPVIVCQAGGNFELQPQFTEPNCRSMSLGEVNPQNHHLWLQIRFDWTPSTSVTPEPLGLQVMGKMASRVWLNGHLLGQNGRPSANSQELAGLMDMTYYVPRTLLASSNNTLVMQLSGYHSIIELGHPIHYIGLNPYNQGTYFVQRNTIPSLVLVGGFILCFLYFSILAIQRAQYGLYWLLSLMGLLGGLQLFIEIARALFPYTYPWQDVRLIAVTVCSSLLGMAFLSATALRFQPKDKALHWIYGGLLLTLLLVLWLPGFDRKTVTGISVPVVIASLCLLTAWRQSKAREPLIWLSVYGLFLVTLLVSGMVFHEFGQFVVIAGLLTAFIAQQARDYRTQLDAREADKIAIAKLELALEQSKAQATSSDKLTLSSSGKLEYVNVADICFCKAAKDYSELHLDSGVEKLFSGSLKQLEAQLPASFLRVHRSYMVNLNKVEGLLSASQQDASSALLRLTCGHSIPVSRRLLASVRQTLAQTHG